jgi:CRISPR/Cas system-associated exonuclease Cas4 (RecB family)
MSTKDDKIRLSPSSLNLFLECPKCFWLEQREGIHRPAGPFPSLPGGMDIVIKKYFDRYRLKEKLPPEIEGKVEGKLFPDLEVLNQWRNWRTGLRFHDKDTEAILVGALDDCLIHEGFYIPVDYKTRGFDLKEDSTQFYQNQLNCYSLLLESNKLPQLSFAYLIYFIPKEVKESGVVKFNIEVKKVKTDPEAALKVFHEAVALLKGTMPKSHSECKFCVWKDGLFND